MFRIIGLVLSFLACGINFAAEPACYEYRATYGGSDSGWGSASGACSWYASALSSANGWASSSGSATGTTCVVDYETSTGALCPGTSSDYTCGTPGTASVSLSQRDAEECPEDDCSSMEGMSAYGGVSGSPSGEFCRADDGSGGPGGDCKVKKSGAGMSTGSGWFGQVEFTGGSCSGEDEDIDEGAPNCITSPGGRVCLSKQDKNCGSVNGERVCLDSVPPGSCTLLSGGGAVCDGSPGSTAGPVDSEGDPIEPDAVIEQHDGEGGLTSANYFSQTTINNSAGGVTGSDNDGSGGGGNGDGDGSGPEECTSDEDCFGEVADTECSEDLAACFATTVDGWYGTFGATSLLATSAALYTSIPTGGTCPTATVEILGETHDAMASFCSLMVDNGAVLQLFFQIAWSFGGLLIMLGARSS